MQNFLISELKPHPKHDYFFDNISGDKWDGFLKSVRINGIFEPIVITQDKIIVSGHQRVRACKVLGITSINAEVRLYNDDDIVLKDLLEINLYQRGNMDKNMIKLGRIFIELERIYGISQDIECRTCEKQFDQSAISDSGKIYFRKDIDKNISNEQTGIEKQGDILSAPKFRNQLKTLKEMVRKRKEHIYGESSSTEYILFEPFFKQGIYATIESQLGIVSWLNIPMKDYQNMNSDYEKAKNVIKHWFPSYVYFNHCIDELIKKRDNGTLSTVRRRALDEFLHTTSNGQYVWFVGG